MINENKLIEEIKKLFISPTTPDGSNDFDKNIHAYDEGLNDALTVIENQPKVDEWILIKDRLPEEAGLYLIMVKRSETQSHVSLDFYTGDYDEPHKYWTAHTDEEVVAWLSYPKPPKLEEVKEND